MPRKRLPCSIDGIHYESESAAAKALEIGVMALRLRLRSSNFPEYISKFHSKIQRRKVRIRCRVEGVEYASVAEVARKFKIPHTTIFNRLRSFNYPEYVCATIPKKPPEPPKYSYMANGKKYSTLQEIADAEGVSRECIRQKMNNPSYREYKRFERAQSHNR